jgi:hypothetical protein
VDLLEEEEFDITYNGIQDDTSPAERSLIEKNVEQEQEHPSGCKYDENDKGEVADCVPDPLFDMNVADVPCTLFDIPSISVSQNNPNSSVIASNSFSTVASVPKSMTGCAYDLDCGDGCEDGSEDEEERGDDEDRECDAKIGVGLEESDDEMDFNSCDPGTDLDVSPKKQMHCTFILRSGKRMGSTCNNKTHVNDRCKRHSHDRFI